MSEVVTHFAQHSYFAPQAPVNSHVTKKVLDLADLEFTGIAYHLPLIRLPWKGESPTKVPNQQSSLVLNEWQDDANLSPPDPGLDRIPVPL